MSEPLCTNPVLKRAHLFANLSVVMASLLVGVVLFRVISDAVSTPTITPAFGLARHYSVFRWFETLLESGLRPALSVLGLGILVILIVRYVEKKPLATVFASQDGGFVKRATLFAMVAEVFAWVSLVYGLVAGTLSALEVTRDMSSWAPEGHMPLASLKLQLDSMALLYAGSIAGFFELLLAALLVRSLLLLSAPAEPSPLPDTAPAEDH